MTCKPCKVEMEEVGKVDSHGLMKQKITINGKPTKETIDCSYEKTVTLYQCPKCKTINID